MSESKQDPAMRQRHMSNALTELREASIRLAGARDELFDLDYMPHRGQLARVKNHLEQLIAELSRQRENEEAE